jgi:NAD+ synthase (glutamine-hydrolysing)
MRLLLAQINPIIGDLEGNTHKILNALVEAKKQRVDIVLFPEMSICGYPPEDFLLLPNFIDAIERHLKQIQEATQGIIAIVGTPRKERGHLFNSAAIFQNGAQIGFQDKTLLPTYDVFVERRYFTPSSTLKVWSLCGKRVAITICEDIWQQQGSIHSPPYDRDPIQELAVHHPECVLNLSASPYHLHKAEQRLAVAANTAKTLGCPLLLCNQVGGNDGVIFDGQSFYLNDKGALLACAKGFEEQLLVVDLEQSLSPIPFHQDPMESLYRALLLGIRDYFKKSGFSRACLGLSGGIDSALVAVIAAEALGPENVLGVSMPSRYSSAESSTDAQKLAKTLGIPLKVISIEKPYQTYLDLLAPDFEGTAFDTTEENLQARIRGMLLMALSNKFGYIVLSTGNKSELAMGYATLYGDMCGGLGVISDLPKTHVYALAKWINREREIIPWNTIERPPSAELRPNQKDSDSLPSYEIVDHVLQGYIEEHMTPKAIVDKWGYSRELVDDLIKKIHRNEYKRRQSAPGLRVSSKSFWVGRQFPIVQKWI